MRSPLWETDARALELLTKGGRLVGRMLAVWASCPRCQHDLSPAGAGAIVCGDCRTKYEAQISSVFFYSSDPARIRRAALRLERVHPALFAGEHEVHLDEQVVA